MRGVRKLLGILSDAAALLSLGLCLLSVALWVRSYRIQDSLTWVDHSGTNEAGVPPYDIYTRSVICARGGVQVQFRLRRWNSLSGGFEGESGHTFEHTTREPGPYPLYAPFYIDSPEVLRLAALRLTPTVIGSLRQDRQAQMSRRAFYR
jgi:hypothetical protein